MSNNFRMILGPVVLSAILFAGAGTAQDNYFEMGNKYYEEGDFASAIKMYQKIESSGQESAVLYYNMGNAYFKNGDLGRAILYYHRAKRLNPSDPDIVNNLEFAGRFTGLRMEGVELNPIDTFLKTVVGGYQLNALGWLSSTCFMFLIGLLILKYGIQLQFTGLNSAVILLLILTLV
ncbi:MAG: tetratricopeptide repeat protein, partial [Candidatus Zixiibacteriota bacterium]